MQPCGMFWWESDKTSRAQAALVKQHSSMCEYICEWCLAHSPALLLLVVLWIFFLRRLRRHRAADQLSRVLSAMQVSTMRLLCFSACLGSIGCVVLARGAYVRTITE